MFFLLSTLPVLRSAGVLHGAAMSGGAWPLSLLAQAPKVPNVFDVSLGQFGIFAGCVLTALAVYYLILSIISKHKEVTGRKPTYDEEIKKLRESMVGLAPSEKVEKLIEQFATAATREEVAAVMAAASALVQREVDAHRKEVGHQLTELRVYTHDNVHDLRDQLQAYLAAGEEREQRLSDKLEEHWKGLSRERSASTAALHQRIEATDALMRQAVDQKVDAIRSEIGNLPNKLIELLRNTGAIGGGNRS